MKSNRFKITVKGEDVDDGIRLNALVDQLTAIRVALNQVDLALSGEKEPSLYYRVTKITMNSPAVFEIEAVPKAKGAALHSRRVVSKLNHDLQVVISGKRPKDVGLEVLESYAALVKPMRQHVAQVALEFDNQPLELPRNLEMRIDEILGPDQLELGSVIGSLDVIDVHKQRNLFRIYPTVGPSSIKCQFGNHLLGDAIAGINKFVRISGELHFKKLEKFPHLMKVSKIEVLPERADAVPLSGLRGIAAGALRGASSTDYVERVRRGDW